MSEDKLFERLGKSLPAGSLLFRDGDAGDAMYVIQEGRVRIYKELPTGEKTLAYLGAGDFFGEMALLSGKPRTATAEVVEPTRLFAIDAKTFGSMIRGSGEIALRLIQRMAERLEGANALVQVLTQRDPELRAALGLVRAVEHDGVEGHDGAILIPLDVQGLAEQVGLEPEVARAVVRRLYRLGVVDGAPGGLAVPSPERLTRFVEHLRSGQSTVRA